MNTLVRKLSFNLNQQALLNACLFVGLLIMLFIGNTAWADVSNPVVNEGIGGVAQKVTGNMLDLGKLIIASGYVVGMGFAIASVMKFKAHKDNPTQIPVGTPIALLFIAAALIFLPGIFKSAGGTLFGAEYQQQQGSIKGTGAGTANWLK